MENQLATIHSLFFTGVTTLFFFQSIILFVCSKNNKVRRTMAVVEGLWGLEYLVALILMNTVVTDEEYSLLREKVLVIGNFFIMFTHFFPIQALVPGWLNWKRISLLFLPIVALTILFYGGMYLLGEVPESLNSYRCLANSIGHFNVWFRFVILLSNIIYIVVILKWLYKYEKKYLKWKNNNFSDQEYVDISWMRSYDFIIIGIFVFYMGILLIGGRIPVMFHCTFAIVSFSYLFYKALFYESPYPEDFFANKNQTGTTDYARAEYVLSLSSHAENISDDTFENKIQDYTRQLKQWLEEERPYLYNDFKLTDVSRVLPLNRSYLSRVFNEGFGQNFSEVVRAYRIAYSKELLQRNPSVPMYKIAEMSGFRSDTTFIKAFKQITHLTPTQYRVQKSAE